MGYEELLTKTGTIQTVTLDYTTNADGTASETWASTYTGVKYALQKNSATIRESISGYDPTGTFTLFLLYSQTVSRGDRFIDEDSITYLIEDVEDAGGRGHHKEATVRLLEV